jgi:hypothetical protein
VPRTSGNPEIRLVGDRAQVLRGRKVLLEVPLTDLTEAIAGAADRVPACGILPTGIRFCHDRGDATAVAIEVPPLTRTVRWLADDSAAPFGPNARFATYRVAFPFVVLLIVFRRGELTGFQQLFYKKEPLHKDERLLLPNLYNVSKTASLSCWLCLQHLGPVGRFSWDSKVCAIVDHVFGSAFNRSSEVHEGNSYWTSMPAVDPRVETLSSWQEASQSNPLFPLTVAWKPAGTTMRRELMRMLDQVALPRSLRAARDVAGLATLVEAKARRV